MLEIVKATAPQAEALACLAHRLGGALPYRCEDGASVLSRLTRAGQSLDAQALTAARLLAEGAAAKPETLDVAACTANVTPPWTGGPLAHFWAHRERLAPLLDPVAAGAWPRLEPMLRAACE